MATPESKCRSCPSGHEVAAKTPMHALEWIEQHGKFRRTVTAVVLRCALERQKGECTWCGGPVGKGRSSWCSQGCVDAFNLRTKAGLIGREIEKRDHGVCAACGLDTAAIERFATKVRRAFEFVRSRRRVNVKPRTYWPNEVQNRYGSKSWRRMRRLAAMKGFQTKYHLRQWLRERGFADSRGHLWEADHVVPVAEGGGLCGPEGYRTLCIRCHKAETKKLAARLKEKRKRKGDRCGTVA